jgi:hypothetical protein
MLSGSHDKIGHNFSLDGEIFSKLFYLVDGIYLSLQEVLRLNWIKNRWLFQDSTGSL